MTRRRTRAAAAAAAAAAVAADFAAAFPTPVTIEDQSNAAADTEEATTQEVAVPAEMTRRTRAAAAATAAVVADIPTEDQSNMAADTEDVTTQEAAVPAASEEVSVPTEDIHDFTGTVQSIEDSHIVSNTRMTYNRTLTDFMIYLFANQNHKLVNIARLRAAKAVDDARGTEKQRTAKKYFRLECVKQLKRMNRVEKNPPIHLSGPNAINYEDIASFMGTKRKIVEVDPDLANRLAATEGAAVLNRAGVRGKVKVAVRLGDSSYSAVQSGIAFLYRQCGLERTTEIKEGLALYCKGSKRKGRKLKQDLGLAISEGKKPMSREVYSFLAKKMYYIYSLHLTL